MLHNADMLAAALGAPKQPYYRTRIDKAGALLRSMIKNHPFIDGNKRMGLVTTFLFLVANRYLLSVDNREMVRFALELAESNPTMEWKDAARWVRKYAIRTDIPPETLATRGIDLQKLADELAAVAKAFKLSLDDIDIERGQGGQG